MIVSDTNLIAYLLIPGDRTSLANSVLAKDSEWAVPPLWRSELLNVLSLHLRLSLLTIDDALDIVQKAESLIGGRERSVDSGSVLRLAEQSGCTAYDCEFVHVAQELGVPLVTSDSKLLAVFPQVAVSPEMFIAESV